MLVLGLPGGGIQLQRGGRGWDGAGERGGGEKTERLTDRQTDNETEKTDKQ